MLPTIAKTVMVPMAIVHSALYTVYLTSNTIDSIVLPMSASTTYNFPISTVVTRKGQVTIPASIRQALNIKQGDSVTFEIEGKTVKLEPAHSTLAEGYRSIPALKKPLTEQEMEEIAGEEIAEAHMKKFR